MSLLLHLGNEIVGATWRASLVIALIFALRPLLVRWLPMKVMPWLWLMIAIKLLLISAPAGWWSIYNLTALARFFHSTPPLLNMGLSPVVSDEALSEMPRPTSSDGESWNWALLLSLVWLLGVVLLVSAQIGAYIQFHRQIAGGENPVGLHWQNMLEECAKLAGVKSPLLLETRAIGIGSPAVIGLLRPKLLLPHGLLDRLEPEEVRLVFMHELSHLRRRDLWLLTLFAMARTVHWFNPLVWLAERALRIDCEAACDAEVLRLTSSLKEHYGRTLLRLTQLSSLCDVSVLIAPVSTNSNQTQRRLQMIMRYQNPTGWMSVAAVVLAAGLCVLTLPNEVVAQDNIAPAPSTGTKPGIALLQQKLKSIVIAKVNFDKTDIADVVQFLQAKSKELDPDKEGVSFVLRLAPLPTEQKLVIHREVSLTLENIALADVLTAITQQTNLQYSVQDHAVYLHPAVDDSEILSVRTYLVPPNFPLTMAGKPWPKDATQVDVTESMQAHGIMFPVGATATYLPESNKLVVRNTPGQLDLIVKLFDASAPSRTDSTTNPDTDPVKPNVIQKLRGISFSVDFNAVTLQEALNFLSIETKRLTPDHQAVGFIIQPLALSAAKPITLTLNQVPFGSLLENITELAGVSFMLGDDVVEIVPTVENNAVAAQPDTQAGQATLAKLKTMIVDKVNFQQLDVQKILDFLALKSRELDPDKRGINFVLGNIAPTDHVHRPVTVVLDNVPMSDLLDYITQQTNLHYSVGDNTVLFKP